MTNNRQPTPKQRALEALNRKGLPENHESVLTHTITLTEDEIKTIRASLQQESSMDVESLKLKKPENMTITDAGLDNYEYRRGYNQAIDDLHKRGLLGQGRKPVEVKFDVPKSGQNLPPSTLFGDKPRGQKHDTRIVRDALKMASVCYLKGLAEEATEALAALSRIEKAGGG